MDTRWPSGPSLVLLHRQRRRTRRAHSVAGVLLGIVVAGVGAFAATSLASPADMRAGSTPGDTDGIGCRGGSTSRAVVRARPSPEKTGTARVRSAGATAVTGVDVSRWDGAVPFRRVQEAGHTFAIIKTTQGDRIVDPAARRHLAGARMAGLVTGAYHFFDYRVDGVAQADHFIDTLLAEGAVSRSLPPAVDVECFAPFGEVDQAVARGRLRALVDRVYERIGRYVIIYTSRHMWAQVTGNDPTFTDDPLWVACWRCERPRLPAGWTRYRIWQRGSVTVPGIAGPLDGDVFHGGATDLERWRERPVTVVDAVSTGPEDAVTVDLGTLDGVAMRVATDGGPWTPWTPRRQRITVVLPAETVPMTVALQLRASDGTTGPFVTRAVTRAPIMQPSRGAIDPGAVR